MGKGKGRGGGKVSLLDVAPDGGISAERPTTAGGVAASATAAGAAREAHSRFSIVTNPDQIRLLYILSKYSSPARQAGDDELCMRQLPLLVLIYEAIVDDVLDYDYAPISVQTHISVSVCHQGLSKNVWMNVSQEGVHAIDDFIMKDLCRNIKLQSRDFSAVTAYQVTEKGLNFLARAPKEILMKVDDFLYRSGDILQVRFDGEGFEIYTASGFSQQSGITDTEDVSYVSSPWLPQTLRFTSKPMRSMAHRAHEAAEGISNLHDELESAILLSNVNILVAEWIPLGSNQLTYLMDRLGVLDRCQGGLFTAQIDNAPSHTKFVCPAGLTQVRVLDFDLTEAINFEAEIQYPEDPGIIQVEYFGTHMEVDGGIMIGLKVEAVEKAMGDKMSVDLLCRVVVDLMSDSSRIIDDLLSEYQRVQMEMVFRGESLGRDKFSLFLADSIDPLTKAESYLNDPQYVAELRQLVGDVQSVHCLSSEDCVIQGSKAIIAAGPRCKRHDDLLARYMVLCARDNFVKNVFVRLKVLNATLLHIRDLLIKHTEHPNRGNVIRDKLSEASRDISLLTELQQYLVESLEGFRVPPLPSELSGRKMYSFLDLHTRLKDAMLRARDLRKLIEGAGNEYRTLVKMMDVVGKSVLEKVVKHTKDHTRELVLKSQIEARNSESVQMVNIIMAGTFIFNLIDKAVGGVQNWNGDYQQQWLLDIDRDAPLAIFAAHIFAFLAWSRFLIWFMGRLADGANGFITWRLKMNRRIDSKALTAWVSTKQLTAISVDIDRTSEPPRKVRKTYWTEIDHPRWRGPPPSFEVYYDQTNGFLLQVMFQLHAARSDLTQAELLSLFQDDLVANRILEPENRLTLPEFQTTTPEGGDID